MSYKFAYNKNDTESIRLSKRLIFIVALACTLCGLVWAGMFYLVYGFCLTVALPLSFVVIVFISLVVSHLLKNHYILVYAQLFCITWIGAAIQWSIGGVAESGMVVWWCFLGPTGALVFLNYKHAIFWLLQFVVIVFVSILSPPLLSGLVRDTPEHFRNLFYLLNMTVPSIIVFSVSLYFLVKMDKLSFSNLQLLKMTEHKNNEIVSSIVYAKRLQKAILPSHSDFVAHLSNAFVLFNPKDIVSGDFYWIDKNEDKKFFAVADCTGHGVPGSMVSLICHEALNRSVKEFKINEPSEILNKTREILLEKFEKSDEEIYDGMDIALCALKGNKVFFAGAFQSLVIVRDGEVLFYKGDRQPVGKHHHNASFSQQEIEVEKNDMLYIFTDGFVDQFGGKDNKKQKYKFKRFKQVLLDASKISIAKQEKLIKEDISAWQGFEEQTDDMCLMGIRID